MTIEADDRVAKRDDERFLRHERTRRQHGVAQTQRLALTRVEVLHVGALELQRGEQFFLAVFTKQLHQLFVDVEMILERRLARAGDEQDAPQPIAGQLFADVLHHRLTADRQHLFRLRFGRRQQPRPKPGDRDDGDVDAHDRGRIITGGSPAEELWQNCDCSMAVWVPRLLLLATTAEIRRDVYLPVAMVGN